MPGLTFLTPGLAQRILILSLVLGVEAIIASLLFDGETLTHKQGLLTALVSKWAAWVARASIGFAALFTTFAYLRHQAALETLSEQVARTVINVRLVTLHALAIALFGVFSTALYKSDGFGVPSDANALAWMSVGAAGVICLALAVVPGALWVKLVRSTGRLWAYAFSAAILACFLGALSFALWAPATKVTFALVKLLLSCFVSDMVIQPAAMRIGTHRFTAVISAQCSGLEGVGLLVIFGSLWLWLFRKEIRFPQSLLLLPAGVVVLYALKQSA